MDLSPEDVEVVRAGGAVNDLNVAVPELFLVGRFLLLVASVVGEVEHSFDSRLRVLWSLSVHAVRQHHNDARLLSPLCFRTHNEVVDDDLSAVHEVTELGLPNHKAVGVGDRVAVLEAEHSELAEMAVGDSDLVRNGLEEAELFDVLLLIADQGVALREGSSFDVLS